MNIFYWSLAFLAYEENVQNNAGNFNRNNSIAAIVLISVYGFYAIVRCCFNPIAGLYMFKRLLLATILVAAVYDDKIF